VREKNAHTGRCMSNAGGKLHIASCDSSPGQSWFISLNSDLSETYSNQSYPGECLDESYSSHLRTFSCNGQNFQKWTFG
jgi:hypothetical protein